MQLLPNTLSLAQETFADDLRQQRNKPVYAIEGFEELMEIFRADVAVENMAAVEHRLTAVENPVLRTEAMMSAASAFWRSVDQAQIHRLACANNSPPPFSKRKPATDCVCDGDISPVTSKPR